MVDENNSGVHESPSPLFTGSFLFFVLFVLLFYFMTGGNYVLAFLLAFFPVGILGGMAENNLRRSLGSAVSFFVILLLSPVTRMIADRIINAVSHDSDGKQVMPVIRKLCSIMVVPGSMSMFQMIILTVGVVVVSITCLTMSGLLPEKFKFSPSAHRTVLFLIRMTKLICCSIIVNIVAYKILVKLSCPPGYSFLVYLFPLCFMFKTWEDVKKDIKRCGDSNGTQKLKTVDVPDTRLSDVAGMHEVKEQIKLRMILPVKQPKTAEQHGITAGGGMLLYGPPGTGKTFIARAVAGELKVPFYAITVADIFSKYVGESENNIRAIFEEIRQNDMAVLFIDELESIFRKRTGEIHETTQKVISILLQELDGIQTHKCKLLLIGATNTPHLVDEAFLRTGRLDVQIFVGLPDKEARKQILENCFKDIRYPIQHGVIDAIAECTENYSGADLKGLALKVKQTAFAGKLQRYTYELFQECLVQTPPSPNAHILRQIREWEQEYQR